MSDLIAEGPDIRPRSSQEEYHDDDEQHLPPFDLTQPPASSPLQQLHKTKQHERALRRASMDAAPYDISYRPSLLLLYSRPVQRQKWGDTQILPRIDWGDLFFDLFYVGATFNVSNIMTAAPTARGLLYASATFFGVMSIWNEKMFWDGRFVFECDDLYHRMFQLALLLTLAVAVLNIRTLDLMVRQKKMAVFCLALVLERILNLLRYFEAYCMGIGQRQQIQYNCKSAARNTCISLSFSLAATVVAWNQIENHTASSSSQGLTTTSSSSGYTALDDLPIILILCGFLAQFLTQNIHVLFFLPRNGRHKEVYVSMRVSLHAVETWLVVSDVFPFTLPLQDRPIEHWLLCASEWRVDHANARRVAIQSVDCLRSASVQPVLYNFLLWTTARRLSAVPSLSIASTRFRQSPCTSAVDECWTLVDELEYPVLLHSGVLGSRVYNTFDG
jgi:hypothetical protein